MASSIKMLYREVDPQIKSWFEIERRRSLQGLSNGDKILVLRIETRQFENFSNEISHLVVKSLEENKIVYFAPNHPVYDPRDFKTADLLYIDDKEQLKRIECKTFDVLLGYKASEISKQFALAKNIKDIEFSIIYREPGISKVEFYNILYRNLGVNPNKIRLISIEELKEICNKEALNRFFKLNEDKNLADYNHELNKIDIRALKDIVVNTDDLGIKQKAQKILKNKSKISSRESASKDFYKTKGTFKEKEDEADDDESSLNDVDLIGFGEE